MKQILKLQFFLLIFSIFLGVQLNANPCNVYSKNQKNTKLTYTKITGLRTIQSVLLFRGIWHLCDAFVCAKNNLNDNKSSVGQLLKSVAKGFLTELGGAYASFFTIAGLSQYIKKLKGSKVSSSNLKDIPAQFNQDNYEDTDIILVDILFHLWVVASTMRLAYLTTGSYKRAFENALKTSALPGWEEIERSVYFFGVIPPQDMLTILTSPIFLSSRLYTAYNSMKTIGSKVKNLIANYKKELPKCSLGNSNGSSRKNN